MTLTAYLRGHLAEYDFDRKSWVYFDDRSPISVERPCVRCGRMPTKEGYDACLGYIPNVKSACCGHGVAAPILMELSLWPVYLREDKPREVA